VGAFTIDVEDWFHFLEIEGIPPTSAWDSLPGCVEEGLLRLFDLLDRRSTVATCFFLGWIAQRYPHLVREAVSRGHEIASHGFDHRLVYSQTPREFGAAVLHTRQLLEDIAGRPVRGFRAPGFSAVSSTPWFFSELASAGYTYDSSLFPAARAHGGMAGARLEPHRVLSAAGPIDELPISVEPVLGYPLCFFGGGYLRLTPPLLLHRMARRVVAAGRPLMIYLHPREVVVDHPRLAMPLLRRFKAYVNLHTAEAKADRLLTEFPLTSCADLLQRLRPLP
jgi:polysaccharide deacetylase family protein (PEP-CTERM system associated)